MSPWRQPLLSGRHPFEVFLLCMCAGSGIPLAFGAPRPGSINDVLPEALAVGWGLALAIGSVVALTGIWWRNRVSGIILEQIGLVSVGWAAIIYGVAVVIFAGWAAAFPATFVLGFGVACLVRWRQLQKILDYAYQQASS